MRLAVETGGGEDHGQFIARSVGIYLTHEDPVYRDSRLTIVATAETEPAHAGSREAECCYGAGQVGFRVSPAGGPCVGPVNPGARIAHGRIRIFNACRSAPGTTGHVERIDDNVAAARGGGTTHRDHHGVTAGCERRGLKHGFGCQSRTSRGSRASSVDRGRRTSIDGHGRDPADAAFETDPTDRRAREAK